MDEALNLGFAMAYVFIEIEKPWEGRYHRLLWMSICPLTVPLGIYLKL